MSEPRKYHRSRGASDHTRVIYDALWEAWEDGDHCDDCPGTEDGHGGCLGSVELLQYCVNHFNRSSTTQMHLGILSNKHPNRRVSADDLDWTDVARKRMQMTRTHMVSRREVVNLGAPRRPVWVKGKPPKHWHPRSYTPGRFRDYVPARGNTELHQRVRRMAWPGEVRAELGRSKPRAAQMQALLAEALDLYGPVSHG